MSEKLKVVFIILVFSFHFLGAQINKDNWIITDSLSAPKEYFLKAQSIRNSNVVNISLNDSIKLIAKIIKIKLDKVTKSIPWESGYPVLSDEIIFGTDGADYSNIRTKLESLEIIINNRKIKLATKSMYEPGDPYLLSISKRQFIIEKKPNNSLILKGYFSDGSGGYNAEWLIVGNTSVRTKINHAEQ